jgi:hypothetical protein
MPTSLRFFALDTQFVARAFGFAVVFCVLAAAIVLTHRADQPRLVVQALEGRAWVAAGFPSAPVFSADAERRAAEVVAHARQMPSIWRAADAVVTWSIPIGIGGAVLLTVLVTLLRSGISPSGRADKHLRGARVVSLNVLRATTATDRAREFLRARGKTKPAVRIAALALPESLLPYHMLIAGTTGVGKSQLIRSLLRAIRARGERAIVADVGGDLLATLVAPNDLLLNPLDARSRPWSPFAEMRGASDADRIAQIIIPDAEGDAGEWHKYSQSLLGAVLERLYQQGAATNEQLLHYLTVAKSEKIEPLIAGLPAQTLFDTGAAKMLSSVRGIIGSYLPSYRYLPGAAGVSAFSISRWIETESSSWMWLPYRDRDASALRPLLGAWIGEAISAVQSLPPSDARRIWFVLDECASLGRIHGLTDALTKGRKYGLCAVIGIQDISQLRALYGREPAATLLSCLRSTVVFNTPDPETADYLSRRLGEAEIVREAESRGERGSNVSEQRTTQRVVLASELQNLPNLAAYLKLAGDYPMARVQIRFVPSTQRIAPFVPRNQKQEQTNG